MDTSQVARPVPFMQIEYILRTRHLDRQGYLEARKAIKAWHLTTVGRHEQITPQGAQTENMKFIDCKLTEEQIKDAQEWCSVDDPKLSTIVNETLLDGYRVTFTFDMKNDCIVVTLIGRTSDCPNKDMAMTTRHGTVRRALHLAMYKQQVIFKGGAWGEISSESQYG